MWFITFDLIKKYNLWFITYDQKHEMYKSTRCTLTKNTRRTLWCHIDLNTMLSICNLSSRNQSNYIWQSQVSIGLWNPPYDSKLNKNIIKRGSSRLSWEMDKTTPPHSTTFPSVSKPLHKNSSWWSSEWGVIFQKYH